MLTPLERKLTVQMLKIAAERCSMHGCNDLNLQKFGLTPKEITDLHQQMAVFNKTPNEPLSGPFTMDWFLMDYLAYKLDLEK